jgi:hypothetical protein
MFIWSSSVAVTVTIETSMRSAHLAGLLQALTHLSTRAMQSHLQIVLRNPDLLRNRFGGLAVDVR